MSFIKIKYIFSLMSTIIINIISQRNSYKLFTSADTFKT